MKVNELIDYLLKIQKENKGDYSIIDDGYLNEINIEDIRIDEQNKEIIL